MIPFALAPAAASDFQHGKSGEEFRGEDMDIGTEREELQMAACSDIERWTGIWKLACG